MNRRLLIVAIVLLCAYLSAIAVSVAVGNHKRSEAIAAYQAVCELAILCIEKGVPWPKSPEHLDLLVADCVRAGQILDPGTRPSSYVNMKPLPSRAPRSVGDPLFPIDVKHLDTSDLRFYGGDRLLSVLQAALEEQ